MAKKENNIINITDNTGCGCLLIAFALTICGEIIIKIIQAIANLF